MILSELGAYIKDRGQVSLADVVNHFDVDVEVARNMLQVWIRKGKVQRLKATASCGTSCAQCDPSATEIYTWKQEGGIPYTEKECPAVVRGKMR